MSNTAENTPVPLMAPLRAFEEQENEILESVTRVLKSGMWVYSVEGVAFETEIAEFINTPRTVAVNSGTDALLLSLQALGLQPGDEVITPAYSFFASASVIAHHKAKPVFVDVSDKTFNTVHLYGLPADMTRINEIAEKHGLWVLEDACQAIGAKVDGKSTGSIGDLAAFSFYPTKNLGASGEGGLVSGTNTDALEIVSKLRLHGETKRYHHSLLGRNSRLNETQAAILRIRLRKLGEWNGKRREIAGQYTDAWADLPLRVPYEPENYEHVYHLYVIQSRDREKLREFLSARNIGNGVYYPVTLPGLEIFESLGHQKGEFPVGEELCRRVLALPMFPQMTAAEVDTVISSVLEFHGHKS